MFDLLESHIYQIRPLKRSPDKIQYFFLGNYFQFLHSGGLRNVPDPRGSGLRRVSANGIQVERRQIKLSVQQRKVGHVLKKYMGIVSTELTSKWHKLNMTKNAV